MKIKFFLFATVLCLIAFSSCQNDELAFEEEVSLGDNIEKRCEVCPAFPNQSTDDKLYIDDDGIQVQFNPERDLFSFNLWFHYLPNTIYELPPHAYILVEIVEVDCNDPKIVIEGGEVVFSKQILPNKNGFDLYFVEGTVDCNPEKCYALRITSPEGSILLEWQAFL